MLEITAKCETSLKWAPVQSSTLPPNHVIKCVMKDGKGKKLTIDRAVLAPDGKHAQVFFNPPANIALGGVVTVWPSGFLYIEHWPKLVEMFKSPAPSNGAIWDASTLNWKGWLAAYSKVMKSGGGMAVSAQATPTASSTTGGFRKFKPQEFRANSIAAKFIGHFEGLELKQYYCAAGISSIGYGTTRFYNGEPIPEGATITKEQALELFKRDSLEFMAEIQRLVDVPLTARQVAVVLSFCYNCGWQAFEESTLLKVINKGGSPAEVREQLRRWTNGGLAGLVRRRNAEAILWENRDDWEKAGYD